MISLDSGGSNKANESINTDKENKTIKIKYNRVDLTNNS